MNSHNIRKKDISVTRNYRGMWVLSTIHNGYFEKYVSDDTLKNARIEFIMKLRVKK
jgi:hypothetical protein